LQRLIAFVSAALIFASYATADSSALQAHDVWIRVTPGAQTAAAYMTLRNPGSQPVTITGIESPMSAGAMIHQTTIEGGVSRMRPAEPLVIPAFGTVKLSPGGIHVMLHGLSQTPLPGQSVPLILRLADGGTLRLQAAVRPFTAE
jgi:copper(I)-binding protein